MNFIIEVVVTDSFHCIWHTHLFAMYAMKCICMAVIVMRWIFPTLRVKRDEILLISKLLSSENNISIMWFLISRCDLYPLSHAIRYIMFYILPSVYVMPYSIYKKVEGQTDGLTARHGISSHDSVSSGANMIYGLPLSFQSSVEYDGVFDKDNEHQIFDLRCRNMYLRAQKSFVK